MSLGLQGINWREVLPHLQSTVGVPVPQHHQSSVVSNQQMSRMSWLRLHTFHCSGIDLVVLRDAVTGWIRVKPQIVDVRLVASSEYRIEIYFNNFSCTKMYLLIQRIMVSHFITKNNILHLKFTMQLAILVILKASGHCVSWCSYTFEIVLIFLILILITLS